MKVKIKSDGSPMGTRIYNLKTGEIVGRVDRLYIDITPDKYTAYIEKKISVAGGYRTEILNLNGIEFEVEGTKDEIT